MYDNEPIDDFRFDYRWLSNFHMCPVMFEGMMFDCSEAAYQAAKTTDLIERAKFQHVAGNIAKKMGRGLTLRDAWDKLKYKIMFDIVCDKYYRNTDLMKKLQETGCRPLIEGNTWGDTYWGDCNGKGQNKLGIISMHIRDTIPMELLQYYRTK